MRIISNDTKFQENILQLRYSFLERNYLESIVDEALGNVSSLTQDDALQTSVKSGDKSVIPFVIEYNPSLPNIGLINKYWDLLQLSHKDSVSSVHAYKPILAFKRPKKLRDYLVRSSSVIFLKQDLLLTKSRKVAVFYHLERIVYYLK